LKSEIVQINGRLNTLYEFQITGRFYGTINTGKAKGILPIYSIKNSTSNNPINHVWA